MALGINKDAYVNFNDGKLDSWKRIDWGKDEAVQSTLIAATDDCFLAVPDGKPGNLLFVSSDSKLDPKGKSIKASLLDMDARLKQSGKAIKEVLALAGSSFRIALCVFEYDIDDSTSNTGEATGKDRARY